jgi:AcrR family transcriptional regulator
MRKSQNAPQDGLPASLRSRKKLRTRQEIADAALLLFAKQGFDAVTVADIASAAEVSEQTVYNYFKTKESLVFDEDEAFEARFVTMVRERPKKHSVLDAARSEARAFLDSLSRRPAGPQDRGSMPYLVATSAALRRHWLAVVERHGHAVAHALIADGNATLSLPEAKILGASLLAVFAVILDELGQTMKSGGDVLARIESLRHQVDGAFDRMADGFRLAGGKRS